MSESGNVEFAESKPEFKRWLPPWRDNSNLSSTEREKLTIEYVKEDMHSSNPYMKQYNSGKSERILGTVLPTSKVAYGDNIPTHSILQEAERTKRHDDGGWGIF